jgi:hypothetical protein
MKCRQRCIARKRRHRNGTYANVQNPRIEYADDSSVMSLPDQNEPTIETSQ